MYNLQTYKEYMLHGLENFMRKGSSSRYTEKMLFSALNDAQSHFAERIGAYRDDDYEISVVADTYDYTLPTDMLAYNIREIVGVDSNGKRVRIPGPIPFTNVLDTTNTTEYQTGWTITPSGSLRLFPVPSEASTLILTYDLRPVQLERIFHPDSGYVCTVTKGSATVTITVPGGGTYPSELTAGDDFGVRLTTQSDGTAAHSAGESPIKWYRIASVSSVASTVTLTSVYTGESGSGQYYMTAQVSELERYNPGKLGMALANYAIGYLIMAREPAKGTEFLRLADAQSMAALPNLGGTVTTGNKEFHRSPFFCNG